MHINDGIIIQILSRDNLLVLVKRALCGYDMLGRLTSKLTVRQAIENGQSTVAMA